jgi:N-acetylneuraminic acid mutarotase
VNGKIYVFGGSGNCTALTCEIFGVVDEYDPATDTWTTKADMPTPRSLLASAVVDGKIYVISGFLEMRGPVGAEVEAYDPEIDQWEKKANIPEVRTGAAAIVIDNTIYIFGGTTAAGGRAQASIFTYDTQTDNWRTLDDMPFNRFLMTASALEGKIYLIGGSGTPYPHDPILSEVVEVSLEN